MCAPFNQSALLPCRREEARQALALRRLHNFYADVRSTAVFNKMRTRGHSQQSHGLVDSRVGTNRVGSNGQVGSKLYCWVHGLVDSRVGTNRLHSAGR